MIGFGKCSPGMIVLLGAFIIFSLLIAGLLVLEVSTPTPHLNPNITATVIRIGTEMVTMHIGADRHPVETTEAGQAPYIPAAQNIGVSSAYALWTQAPRSYRATFVESTNSGRTEAEMGLLPDLRGPPRVI
jgi:hypothetical protein